MQPEPRPTVLDRTSRHLPGRRGTDGASRSWAGERALLLGAFATPLRPVSRLTALLAVAVLVLETVGFTVRRACASSGCGGTGWASTWDMDALGSVPRALVTLVLAAGAAVSLWGVRRSGRSGAGLWWLVLGLGCALLAAAKHSSLHSVVEVRLAGVLPGADVQLLFVVVSALGLAAVTVSGRWVRRETRTAVTTWLALYALAGVGLAAVTIVLAHLGPVVADLATLVEETGEGLAAVGLLAALLAGTRELAARGAGDEG